jgi:hypothetical protein
MEDIGIFYGHLDNFPAILYPLWHFGIFLCSFGVCMNVEAVWYIFPVLVSCIKKNLATLYWKIQFWYIVPRKNWQPCIGRYSFGILYHEKTGNPELEDTVLVHYSKKNQATQLSSLVMRGEQIWAKQK